MRSAKGAFLEPDLRRRREAIVRKSDYLAAVYCCSLVEILGSRGFDSRQTHARKDRLGVVVLTLAVPEATCCCRQMDIL
jgi:hypothetical protein